MSKVNMIDIARMNGDKCSLSFFVEKQTLLFQLGPCFFSFFSLNFILKRHFILCPNFESIRCVFFFSTKNKNIERERERLVKENEFNETILEVIN